MDSRITFSITIFTGFFAIINPISNRPIFLTLMEGTDKKTKQRVNKKAVLVTFITVCTFAIMGKFIF